MKKVSIFLGIAVIPYIFTIYNITNAQQYELKIDEKNNEVYLTS
jgi:hypothetical protein